MQRFTRIFPVLFIVISMSANSQFAPGTRMAGASVGSIFFNSGNSDQTVTNIGSRTVRVKEFGVNFTPSLGWFISENTAAGFSFSLNTFKSKTTFEESGSTFQQDKNGSFDIGIGGFVRNYFQSSGTILPFGQLHVDAGISNNNADGFLYTGLGPTAAKETYDGKASGGFFADAILTAGITKMVGKYTGLDISIGYNFHYAKNTMKTTRLIDEGIDGVIDETRTSEVTTKFTNHRFIVGIGFQVFLEKKKK
jgi:hypothetical protein